MFSPADTARGVVLVTGTIRNKMLHLHPNTTAVIINCDTHREGRLNFVNWYRQQV